MFFWRADLDRVRDHTQRTWRSCLPCRLSHSQSSELWCLWRLVADFQQGCHGYCKDHDRTIIRSLTLDSGVEWRQCCPGRPMRLRDASRHLPINRSHSQHHGLRFGSHFRRHDWVRGVLACHLLLFGHPSPENEGFGLCKAHRFHNLRPCHAWLDFGKGRWFGPGCPSRLNGPWLGEVLADCPLSHAQRCELRHVRFQRCGLPKVCQKASGCHSR